MFALILDVAAPVSGTTLLAAGAGVFFIAVALAYIVFRLLRKTIRMAFRMAIVAAIVVFVVVGSASLWWLSSRSSPTPRPTPSRGR